MELKYRSISYQAFPPCIQATSSEKMGVYRGISYRPKSTKALMYQPAEELIYRGVRYVR